MNFLSYEGLVKYTQKLNVIFDGIKDDIAKIFAKIKKNEDGGYLQGKNLYTGSNLTLTGGTYVNPILLGRKINKDEKVTVSYNLDWAYQTNLQVKFIFYNDSNVEVFAAEEYIDASTERRSMTVTATEEATKIAFWIGNGGYIRDIQIEIGETATDYTKYVLSNTELNTKMVNFVCNEYQDGVTYNPGQYCISGDKLFRNLIATSAKPTDYASEWAVTNLVSELGGLKYKVSNVITGRSITAPSFNKVCIVLGCRGAADIHVALKNSGIGTGVWSIANNGILTLSIENDTLTVSSSSNYNSGIVFLYD